MTHYYNKNSTTNPHNICLPNNFRMLIVGASGSGKTTLLMKLLLQKHLINYDKLYIYSLNHCINQNIEIFKLD